MLQWYGWIVYNCGVYVYPNRAYRGYGIAPPFAAAAKHTENSNTNPQNTKYANSFKSKYTTSGAGPALEDAIASGPTWNLLGGGTEEPKRSLPHEGSGRSVVSVI
jgi:hypothetical protein